MSLTSDSTFCVSGFDRLLGGYVPDNTGWQLSPGQLNHIPLMLEKGLDIPSMPGDIFSQEEPWMRSLKREWDLLLLFSCSVVSNSLQPYGLQRARLLSSTVYWGLLKFMSIKSVMPSNGLSLRHPLLLLPQSSPASGSSSVSWLFTSVVKILELELQHQSFQWIFSVDFL